MTVINKINKLKDKTLNLVLFVFLLVSCNVKATQPSQHLEMSRDEYYDKTLACIIGHIGGFLSGFEFVNSEGGQPYVGLPDDWFSMCYGPYGGGPKRGSAGENVVIAYGEIRQDDDYHVDFFNQLIFSQSADLPTSLDIQRLWKYHQVRDWGGGAKAMEIMNMYDYIPPFTGQLEYGNIFSWCTEPYIENETVGCVAPGMPQTADMLTNRFALTTGEYESVIWARFFGVMYSVAYFENDAVTAMNKASAMLPAWSYARFMYEKALELHQKHPDDWRTAAREMTQYGRHIYRLDNVHVAYDINGGFTVLSILYGNNNYYESIKIASLIGYDSDCTAATVGGLLGIIKGMDGTDPVVKQVVYKNGEGVLVNDGTYVPYIKRNYPERQKFTDIAKLYQQNMERVILERGGSVLRDKYLIKSEAVKPGSDVVIPNRDFEDDYIEVRKEFTNGAQGGVDKIQSFSPHSGNRTARILANQQGASGKVFLKTENLIAGKTYKVGGYLVAKGENRASFFVQNGNQFLTSSTYNNDSDWYYRNIRFTATDTIADFGLFVPPIKAGLFNAYLDDITIDECIQSTLFAKEAEVLADQSYLCTAVQSENLNASQNGYLSVQKAGKIKGISVDANQSGEHLMRIRFSNTSGSVVTARVMSMPDAQAKFPFYMTGDQPYFEENIVEVPIHLKNGSNQLSIEQFSGNILIDKIEIVADSSHFLTSSSDTSETINIHKEPYLVKVYSSGNKLIIEQNEYGYSQGIIRSLDGKFLVDLRLYPYKASYNLPNLENGIYLISLLGKAGKKTLKFMNNKIY
jgi:hypothetical protein